MRRCGCIVPTRTPSFWQCQATVLWDPEGNVPGNVRGDVRHFAWLHPPPFRLLLWAEIDGVVCHPGNAPLRLHCAYLHAHRASGDPEGNVPGNVRGNVRGDVRHFAWLHPPPFRLLLWAKIDGVVCHPGNAPLRLHCAYTHTRLLAMPGNCFMGSRRQRAR